MTARRALVSLFGLLVVMSLSSVGCAQKTIELVDDGRSFEIDTVVTMMDAGDPGDLTGRSADQADSLRSKALSSLRQRGAEGTRVADLLTDSFPSNTRGVPFYVERALVDGQESWLVIEAIGRRGGELDDRRLWVLDNEGEVIFSATR
jgi:hypothetical protein